MPTAILLCNMGGPDSLDDVQPYLENIFMDPDIIDIPLSGKWRTVFARYLAKKRAPKSTKIFEHMGGSSPLLEITQKQADRLAERLTDKGKICKVYPAMRYWHPLIPEVWQQIAKEDFKKIVVISLFSYYSTATSGSIQRLLLEISGKYPVNADVYFIDRFGNHPEFIHAMAKQMKHYIGEENNQHDIHILLSAHSIPQSRVAKGDPYQDEIEEAVGQLRDELPENYKLHISYQSKIGPVRWLEPATSEKILELAEQGVQKLWVYPLGFTADNSETIYEIGSLYHDLAKEHGIKEYIRIPALNDDNGFIAALERIIIDHVD